MLLKHIYLYLNLDEYPAELSTQFGFRTRYLCNFLERSLRAVKFKANGFSKICVQGCHEPDADCPIVAEHAAVPSVAFDQRRYESLGAGEYHEFYIAMLLEGIEKCAQYHRVPLAELKAAVDEFRRGGYRNAWIHQKTTLRPIGIDASLNCSLDTDRFTLTLRLERKGRIIFDRQILETKPDELIFAYQFKDVVLDDTTIVVRNKFDKPTFVVSADSVA